MTCTTPMVRPREMRGAQSTERVWNWVSASKRRAKRGSLEVSLTMVGSPVWATQPAIPSPTFTRNDGHVLALLAQGQLEGQLLLLLVQHEDGPGLGGDQLLDLGHDQLDDLARLQDRVGRLHDVGEDGQALGGRAQPRLRVPGRGAAWPSRARAASRWASTSRAGGSPGAPGAEVEVEAELARALQDRRRRSAGRRCPPAGGAGRGAAPRSGAPARRRGRARRGPRRSRRPRGAARPPAAGGKNS